MSPRRPRSSSSVSRKTSLSSTKATRTPTKLSLLGAQEDGVPGLPALVHLDLEARARRRELGDEAVELRRLRAGQDREEPVWLGQQAIEDGPHHLVEGEALRHPLTFDDAGEAAVARMDAAGDDGVGRCAHRREVLVCSE